MKLGKKQELFSLLLAKQIAWVYGYKLVKVEDTNTALRMGEVYRPKVTAEYYASVGKGVKRSTHISKLGADVVLSIDGAVTWDNEDYLEFANHWISLHGLARAGHFFRGKIERDSGHISLEHNGVK